MKSQWNPPRTRPQWPVARFRQFLAGCLALALATALTKGLRPSPASLKPLTQEAYLWQRNWTPAVKRAIETEAPALQALHVQAGEVSAKTGRLEVVRATVDWKLLAGLKKPVGVAWRVGAEVVTRPGNEALEAMEKHWATTFASAAASDLRIAEAQWDCDCLRSRLSVLKTWVARLKQRHPDVRWTFTALPSWQSSPAFHELAAAADGFVLQVHWLHPSTTGSPVLMEVDEAMAAVATASRHGIVFKVALPTYGSAVVCNAQGQWLSVISEEAPPVEDGTHLVETRASPADTLRLLAAWQQQRPERLEGIIWYRLPVEGDRRNWSWPQLQAVMSGATPQPHWEAALVAHAEGYEDVVITNSGNGDAPMPQTVSLHMDNLLAFDAAFGYNAREVEHSLIFSAAKPRPLAAGGHASIGWVRRENMQGEFHFEFGL